MQSLQEKETTLLLIQDISQTEVEGISITSVFPKPHTLTGCSGGQRRGGGGEVAVLHWAFQHVFFFLSRAIQC